MLQIVQMTFTKKIIIKTSIKMVGWGYTDHRVWFMAGQSRKDKVCKLNTKITKEELVHDQTVLRYLGLKVVVLSKMDVFTFILIMIG